MELSLVLLHLNRSYKKHLEKMTEPDVDVELVKFLHGVIQDEIGLNTVATHRASLKEVLSRGEKGLSITSMTSSALRCAYVYYHVPSLTSALARHFRNLLKDNNNSFILQRIVQRGKCSICCISTGPASEFVAIVRALGEVLRTDRCSKDNRMSQLKIEVVVIVPGSQWKSLIRKMADDLSEIIENPGWSLDFRFVSADLTRSLTDDVKEVLGKSDFITMNHYLSSIHKFSNSLEVMQEIIPFIGENSVLFFMDFPKFHLCDALKNLIGSHLKQIYGPISYDIHRMSFMCMKTCIKLYAKYYGWRYCSLDSVSYVCAWSKTFLKCISD